MACFNIIHTNGMCTVCPLVFHFNPSKLKQKLGHFLFFAHSFSIRKIQRIVIFFKFCGKSGEMEIVFFLTTIANNRMHKMVSVLFVHTYFIDMARCSKWPIWLSFHFSWVTRNIKYQHYKFIFFINFVYWSI